MGVPWITLTPADLSGYQLDAILRATRTVGLAVGQGDPALAIIHDQCERVRNYLRANPDHQISATADAIPPELRAAVITVIVTEMQLRLSSALPLTDDQRTRLSRAEKDIQAAAQGDLSISLPIDPETGAFVSRGGALELASSSGVERPTTCSLSGL